MIVDNNTGAWAGSAPDLGLPGGLGVNNSSAMQETQVPSLRQEDPLEKGTATHFGTPAWETHGQRSLAGYRPRGQKE